MLRSTLLGASAVILCTAASAQQTVQAKKVLGPVRDAGIYHVATGTWTRGGSTSNISPDCVYRNDTSSGYFGVGWDGCKGVDEIMLPGPTNPQPGPLNAYTIDGMSFAYCALGAALVDWQYCFYDSYTPCDDPCSPANCICQLPQVYTFVGLPAASACWILTVDLAGGYELCMAADGGTCAPNYQGGGGGLDHGGVGHSWLKADGATTGPILDGNPFWDKPGGITCYRPGPGCPGSTGTGKGAQDLFAICDGGLGGANCGPNPGCYFFGGYLNLNGCNTPSNVPIGQFNLCLFSDCLNECVKDDCSIGPVYCDENTNPNNVADILVAGGCNLGGQDIFVNGANFPLNQFAYLLVSANNLVVQNPPGAKGALCLAGAPIGRYVKDIQSTGTSGTATTNIRNSMTAPAPPDYRLPSPPGGQILPGQTWYFQYWHRQPMGAPSSFSSATPVTFS